MGFCAHCNNKLVNVIDLKKIPIVNNFSNLNHKKFKTKLSICKNCKLFQHEKILDKKIIFNDDYPYISSTSNNLVKHFKKILNGIKLKNKNFFLEIGSNDGSFLKNLKKKNIKHLGVDPSKIACKKAREKGLNIINDFFSFNLSKKILKKYGKVDCIFSANTLAHVENLNDVLKGIDLLLSEKGELYMENIYLKSLLKNNLFDQLYHEHIYTYSIESINNIFSKYNLYINKINFNNMQGGSFLIKLTRKNKNAKLIKRVIANEKNNKLFLKKKRNSINKNIQNKLKNLILFIKNKKLKKVNLTGYGASAKTVMLINLLGLTKKDIHFIVDNTKKKQNKFLPGTDIPVVAPKQNKHYLGKYCVIFSWNFAKEIISKEKNKNPKTKWVIPFPRIYTI